MKKNWSKPKVTIEIANELRMRYQEGTSINNLAKRYDLARNSVKAILRGETYNKWGEHKNLMELSKTDSLF